ncbi:hypothetical protein [Argonema galeatum]|uniref:hypothetical protein n=1 Tax=Argonema galeatum TaxID=2942762 RepID=UPI0020135972|nr:hypothetical protein [Argonema galeatum]MCL1468675.1 hypothetical protein [Argonema galeatum A003/A1]
MQYRLPSPNLGDRRIIRGEDEEPFSSEDMAEAAKKLADASNIPLPDSFQWNASSAEAKLIRFIGSVTITNEIIVNPDPLKDYSHSGGGSERLDTQQILSVVYLPQEYTLRATPTTVNRQSAAGGGISGIRKFSDTFYKFSLVDNNGILVPTSSSISFPVNRLNNYPELMGYHYFQDYFWWVSFQGFELWHSTSSTNIYEISETPIIRPDPLPPPPPPPIFYSPPPPPCDIPITVDPGFRDTGYFCMSHSEYNTLMPRFPQINQNINTTNNLLRESL